MKFSQRLLNYAERRHHLIEHAEDFQWSAALRLTNVSGNNFELAYRWCQKDDQDFVFLFSKDVIPQLERAYLEAFAQLMGELSFSKLEVLGVRELEHFLRDQNHLASHDEASQTPGLWLESLRAPLFRAWFEYRLEQWSHTLHAHSSTIDLITQLRQLDSHFWGKRLPQNFLSLEFVSLVPIKAQSYELTVLFSSEVSALLAQNFCLALEKIVANRGIQVKVVAEA